MLTDFFLQCGASPSLADWARTNHKASRWGSSALLTTLCKYMTRWIFTYWFLCLGEMNHISIPQFMVWAYILGIYLQTDVTISVYIFPRLIAFYLTVIELFAQVPDMSQKRNRSIREVFGWRKSTLTKIQIVHVCGHRINLETDVHHFFKITF